MADEWIVMPRWDEFQHRDMARSDVPPWVKNYTKLLHDDAYLTLSSHQRAVLHGLWLSYASARRQLPLNTRSLTRQLQLRVMRRDLEALNHAGFIEFSASKPAGAHAVPEKRREEVEKKNPYIPLQTMLAKKLKHAQTVLANTGNIDRALNYIDHQPSLSTADRQWLEQNLRLNG